MTAVLAPELCGHRWYAHVRDHSIHRCDEPADHPELCTCRCGATTRRERT